MKKVLCHEWRHTQPLYMYSVESESDWYLYSVDGDWLASIREWNESKILARILRLFGCKNYFYVINLPQQVVVANEDRKGYGDSFEEVSQKVLEIINGKIVAANLKAFL